MTESWYYGTFDEILEHIERTGVHSGDSISVYPAPTISDKVKDTIVEYTKRLAQARRGSQRSCKPSWSV